MLLNAWSVHGCVHGCCVDDAGYVHDIDYASVIVATLTIPDIRIYVLRR